MKDSKDLKDSPVVLTRRDFCKASASSLILLVLPMHAANGEETAPKAGTDYPSFSGIYPHLANFNREGECGTGAVVPWAGKLWFISYAPHAPAGSTDRLYELDENLNKINRPESIGGTPANRMIHKESNQLFIGPYVIDAQGNVRVIDYKQMPGRHTGNARHLTDPANKIACMTMEEGFYEIDVKTLEVKQFFCDSNKPDATYRDILPGYHGKGFYSAQGRYVYANNGERSSEALRRPEIPSGALGQWDGKSENWEVVLRNQFTEVTGPGGIFGFDEKKGRETLWSIGWDFRSLILMVLDGGKWFKYRLPKTSHCYDGAHGWNTEWPRIREVGDPDDFLMTMHGQFWHFPADFSSKKAFGIRPRAAYLKVIGDFCFWRDRIVCGCDDTARSEFLNKSPFKGPLNEPGQSNSNLWFLDPAKLDSELGRPIGRGALWFNEPVKAGVPSEAFLFGGWDLRGVHLKHDAGKTVNFRFEIDEAGDGTWKDFQTVPVESSEWVEFPANAPGEWIRVTVDSDLPTGTVMFQYAQNDDRPNGPLDARFDGLAEPGAQDVLGATFWVRSDNQRLAVVASTVRNGQKEEDHYYELTGNSELVRVTKDYGGGEKGTIERILEKVAVPELPENVFRVDDLSVVCTYEGQEFRLPVACDELVKPQVLPMRLDREAATERDLFHCAGMFYELPAANAGGLPKIRPVARDGKFITDYASYRGLMVLGGIDPKAAALPKDERNPHLIVSEDGKAAVWAGAIDDLWTFGKPAGRGFLWKETDVKASEPSLPFLLTGFDDKVVRFRNHSDFPVAVTLETDLTGTGVWSVYRTLTFGPDQAATFAFPRAFQSYWLRATSSVDAKLTAEVAFNLPAPNHPEKSHRR